MKKCLFIVLILFIATPIALAQVPSATPRPANPAPVQQREGARFEVSEYGISFQADTRLIIMMAALEAAGGHRGNAARLLKTSRTTLYRRMRANNLLRVICPPV